MTPLFIFAIAGVGFGCCLICCGVAIYSVQTIRRTVGDVLKHLQEEKYEDRRQAALSARNK